MSDLYDSESHSNPKYSFEDAVNRVLASHPELTPFEKYVVWIYALYLVKNHLCSTANRPETLDHALQILRLNLSSALPQLSESFLNGLSAEGLFPEFSSLVDMARKNYISHDKLEFHQPKALTDLALDLLDYRGGDVYNPFAGNASYGFKLSIGEMYFAEEKDERLWAITVVEAYLLDQRLPNYICGDAFRNKDKYLYVVSTPPFEFFHPSRTMETGVLEFIDSRLEKEGRAVVVAPLAFLSSFEESAVATRKKLLPCLAGVVQLPGNIANTSGLQLCAVVLDHRRGKNPVRLLDASKSQLSVSNRYYLKINEIEHNYHSSALLLEENMFEEASCSWLPSYYIHNQALQERIHSGESLFPLEDILQVTADAVCNPEAFDLEKLPSIHLEADKIVTESATGRANDSATGAGATEAAEGRGGKGQIAVTIVPTVLIAKRKGTSVRAAYFEGSEEHPASYDRNEFYVFTFDLDRILPDYLLHQLNKLDFSLRSDVYINSYELMSSYIPLPALDEQKRTMQELQIQSQENIKRREADSEQIQDLKNELLMQFRKKRHSLRNALEPLMARVLLEQTKVSMGQKVDTEYMAAFLDEMEKMLTHFSETLTQTTVGIAQFGQAEMIPVLPLLEEFIQLQCTSDKFRIELVVDENAFPSENFELSRLSINVNRTDFEHLLNNILSNAVHHGFTDADRKDYFFRISLSYDSKTNHILFDFSNNGTPMAGSIDEKVYGAYSFAIGPTGRTGQGGAYVKDFAEHYHGNFSLRNDYSQEVKITCIHVELPFNLF